MKTIRIIGGLGNQMFQYAFARVVGARMDIEGFEEYKPHKYCLDKFNIKNIYETQFAKFVRHNFKIKTIHEDPKIIYEPRLMSLPCNCYIRGYFQTEKYFAHIRARILREFSIKEPLDSANAKMLEQIQSHNSVSLHVRRGDYVQLAHIHGLCDHDYYKRAAEYIASKTSNPHFFIFSDDTPWVRENLKLDFPFTVVDLNDAEKNHFDLHLMKSCRHNIIANSSFSWWGAWLNENPDKIVIAPKVWCVSDAEMFRDTLPDNWIKI